MDIERAANDILTEVVDRAIDPSRCSAKEALQLLEELIGSLEIRIDALRQDIAANAGGASCEGSW